MFEIYTRQSNGLLHRDLPVLPYGSERAAAKTVRQLARQGIEALYLPAGKACLQAA
jgi:hypothetical protein